MGLPKADESKAAKKMLAWLEDSKSQGFPTEFFQPGLYAGDQGTEQPQALLPGMDHSHLLIDPSSARTDRRQALLFR